MRTAVLFSGGLDSFLAHERVERSYLFSKDEEDRRYDCDLLFVATDAPYIVDDLQAARNLARYLGKDLRLVESPLELSALSEGPIIPNRNLFLHATATALGYRRVIVAHPVEDLVPDASPRFLRASSVVLSASLDERVIILNALAGETKASALRAFLKGENGPPTDDEESRTEAVLSTRSCYSRQERHCGRCSACFKRWVAFKLNGLPCDFESDPRTVLVDLLSAPGALAPSKWRYALEVLRALRS